MQIICKSHRNYKHIIRECYKTDRVFINEFSHLWIEASVDNCVNTEFIQLSNLKKFTFFHLTKEDGETVGYFGIEIHEGNQCLSGFFIKPEYRNEYIKAVFWHYIKKKTLDREVLAGIYKRNGRAQRFLQKNGFFIINTLNLHGKEVVLLKRQAKWQQQ